jgi:predicted Zn-dependent peptidase
MSDQIKLLSPTDRAARRTIAIEILQEHGVIDAVHLVDLSQSTAMAEKNNNAITVDPVTGNAYTALQLMDQLQSEGKERLGREFSERRGYTAADIEEFGQFLNALHAAINAGADHDEIAYALGVADGQLDLP